MSIETEQLSTHSLLIYTQTVAHTDGGEESQTGHHFPDVLRVTPHVFLLLWQQFDSTAQVKRKKTSLTPSASTV